MANSSQFDRNKWHNLTKMSTPRAGNGHKVRLDGRKDWKNVWDFIIVNYLQPANMLGKKISIEVRNDNGKQFCSDMIQKYFKDNYLNQVFTHPYTPEENAHIESFHGILGKSLKLENFKNLVGVEKD